MKTKYLIFIAIFIASIEIHAQWYGEQLYPVDSVLLSSAKITNFSTGYVMAGYRGVRKNTSTTPDFVICKVDANGQFSTANEFMVNYQISSCGGTPHNCAGICIAECKNPVQPTGANQVYAIAVTSTAGIGFATIDQSGNPVQQVFWAYPNINAWELRNPAIRESSAANIFYITSCFEYSTCVMKVDISTAPITILWSNTYDNGALIEARDIIESPYNPNELIVVGRTDMASNPLLNYWAANAFFMKLDGSNTGMGAVLTHTIYNKQFDGDDWFTCIEPAQSTAGGSDGYILGGRSYYPFQHGSINRNTNFIQWICKLDPSGTMVWSSLIEPSILNLQGYGQEVSRVYERYNSNSASYEVYGTAAMGGCSSPLVCSDGQVVYKLDDNGQNVFTPDEFHYSGAWENGGLVNLYSDVQMTAIETGGGADDGIQVFGTDTYANNFLFTKAYFNGVAGCNDSTISIRQIQPGPDSIRTEAINVTPYMPCSLTTPWMTTNALSPSPSTLCSNASLTDGSNARIYATGMKTESSEDLNVNVYPNPSAGKVSITVPASQTINKILLFDQVGRLIFNLTPKVNHKNAIEIDLNGLNLKNGLYYLDIDTDHSITHKKLMYNK